MKLEVVIGMSGGFEFRRGGSVKFDQKNYRVTDRVWIDLLYVGSGFKSNIIDFLGPESFVVGFWIIQVWVKLGFVSLILDSLGF
jgi:hypothetical protein